MNLDRFIEQRGRAWDELDGLVKHARGRAERLGPDGVIRLGSLHRAVSADLAFARRRFSGDPLVARLEEIIGRSRGLVYASTTRRDSVVTFLTTGYWRRVRERPWPLAVAACLLFGPAILTWIWATRDPARAAALVPAAMGAVTQPKTHGAHLGLPLDVRTAFAAQIFTNNIRVTFVAFAGGITAGFLTAGSLIYNGIIFGVVGGLATGAGQTATFVQLIVPHGALELSCITVGGAAGLRVGWALIDPGRRRRSDALVAEARGAVALALGTALWLVVAGLVEGLITPVGIGVGPALGLGLGLAGVFWALVIWRGAPSHGHPVRSAPSP